MSTAVELGSLYWSIRRELWENRSIYIAPLAVAGVALFGFCLSSFVGIWEAPLRLIPAKHQTPFDMAAGLMMLTGIVVSVFYCLDALHSERRDRSIFFWKSMPVSDLTTVLAKASIPLFVLPADLCVTIMIAMQWIMLLFSSAVVLASGRSVGTALEESLDSSRCGCCSSITLRLLMCFGLIQSIAGCCWCPDGRNARYFFGRLCRYGSIGGFERMTFHTFHFAEIVAAGTLLAMHRSWIWRRAGMGLDPFTTHVTMGRFVSSPGLWIGLALSALFLAAAVRLRRYQGPI